VALIGFGPFEVDTRSGELRRSGVRIRLQEQPFQILLILLEHAEGGCLTRRPHWQTLVRQHLRRLRSWPE
jgi:DNA-binding winged helix-turn-helix (wHTH) protein